MRQKKQIFRALKALALSSLECSPPWTREEIIKSPMFSAVFIGSICGLASHVSGLAAAKILGVADLPSIYLEKEPISFKTWSSYNAMILASQGLIGVVAYYSSFAKNLGSQLYVIPLVLGLQYLNPALLSFKYGINALDSQNDSLAIFANCIIDAITFIFLISILLLLQLRVLGLQKGLQEFKLSSAVVPLASGMQDVMTEGKDRHHREEDRRHHRRRKDRRVSFAPQDESEEGFVETKRSLRAKTPRPKRQDIPPTEEDVLAPRGPVSPVQLQFTSETPVSPSMIGREAVAQAGAAGSGDLPQRMVKKNGGVRVGTDKINKEKVAKPRKS